MRSEAGYDGGLDAKTRLLYEVRMRDDRVQRFLLLVNSTLRACLALHYTRTIA